MSQNWAGTGRHQPTPGSPVVPCAFGTFSSNLREQGKMGRFNCFVTVIACLQLAAFTC